MRPRSPDTRHRACFESGRAGQIAREACAGFIVTPRRRRSTRCPQSACFFGDPAAAGPSLQPIGCSHRAREGGASSKTRPDFPPGSVTLLSLTPNAHDLTPNAHDPKCTRQMHTQMHTRDPKCTRAPQSEAASRAGKARRRNRARTSRMKGAATAQLLIVFQAQKVVR